MRLSRLVPIVFVAFILLVAGACGGGGTYTDEVYGFSIEYPQGWDEWPEEYLIEGTLVGYFDPSPCDGFASNFRVAQEQLQSSMTAQAYWEAGKQQLQADFEEYTSISEEEITICGLPAIKAKYAVLEQNKRIEGMQTCFIEGKTAWIIECASSKYCWSQYGPKFDTIINNFQLLD